MVATLGDSCSIIMATKLKVTPPDDAQYVSARNAVDAIAGLTASIISLLKSYKAAYLAIPQWAL
jgi:hypothetical protein